MDGLPGGEKKSRRWKAGYFIFCLAPSRTYSKARLFFWLVRSSLTCPVFPIDWLSVAGGPICKLWLLNELAVAGAITAGLSRRRAEFLIGVLGLECKSQFQRY
jgi:hypothetical protein